MTKEENLALCELCNTDMMGAMGFLIKFCDERQSERLERLNDLYMNTDIGMGREPSTFEERCEYVNIKYDLLSDFDIIISLNGTEARYMSVYKEDKE